MLEINHLTVKKRAKTLLSLSNLNIAEFGLHAIVGPNGAGKTTFLRSFLGEEGSFRLDGADISNLSALQKSRIISYLPQFSDFLNITVREALALARNSRSGAFLSGEDRRKIALASEEFELGGIMQARLGDLSGGVRQKVLIAATLLEEPRILLLDEPISHLDPKNQSYILDLLERVAKEREIYAFIVLHDISHALHFARKIIMIKGGRLLACKDASDVGKDDIDELFDVYSQIFEAKNHKFVYYSHKHFED